MIGQFVMKLERYVKVPYKGLSSLGLSAEAAVYRVMYAFGYRDVRSWNDSADD